MAEQLAAGLARLESGTKAIAYLQDHTATYLPARRLDPILARIRRHPEVVAIHIGTRPDCLPPRVMDVLAEHGAGLEILVELGLQTASASTLEFIQRRHDLGCFQGAVRRLHQRGLKVCAHVVLGLPSPANAGPLAPESAEDAVATARLVGSLGVEAVKIHHCHVLRDTPLAALYEEGRFQPLTLEGYLDRLIPFLQNLPGSTEIHRLLGEASSSRLVAPAFTADKSRSLQWIKAELRRRGVHQGSAWSAGI